MYNYKLTIQYDGTNYSGWQIQKNSKSVQGEITSAIKVLTKQQVSLIGSGRTDAGVHALGQIANFKTVEKLDLYKFKHSINSILPKDISVIDITDVEDSFHSRFDAKKRSYLYFITNFKSPFFEKYSYNYREAIDILEINKLAKVFIGEKDFTSFSKKNSEVKNRKCIVFDLHCRRTKNFTVFYIEANRFLHGMVRTIIGTLLFAEKNKSGEKFLEEIMNAKNREEAFESAPAKGLFLYKVKY